MRSTDAYCSVGSGLYKNANIAFSVIVFFVHLVFAQNLLKESTDGTTLGSLEVLSLAVVDSGGVAATNPSAIKRRIYPLFMADAALASSAALSVASKPACTLASASVFACASPPARLLMHQRRSSCF
jgi:hypothetical protein